MTRAQTLSEIAISATIWADEAVQTVYDLFPNFPDLFLAYD
jgi:phage gp46-like protein